MFKRAKNFYDRALVMASKTGAKEESLAALEFYQKLTDKFDGSNLEPLKEPEDEATRKQREAIAAVLETKIEFLDEKGIVALYALNEIDFRIQQELASLGWTLTEEEGCAMIYTYLPTAHM